MQICASCGSDSERLSTPVADRVLPKAVAHGLHVILGIASVGGSLLRALVVGLLAAVGTAASLVVSAVRGVMIVIVVGCAAAAAGAIAFANSVKKNPSV
jgi:hypothetical protein